MKVEGVPTRGLMTPGWLESVRKVALRRRVWYRALSCLERGVVELTIHCVDRVRSGSLALALSRIVCKLFTAFRSRFLARADLLGNGLVEKISKLAISWGYFTAIEWTHDSAFIRYLGLNAVMRGQGRF